MSAPILSYNSVCVSYSRPGAAVTRAMHDVSIELRKGEILGIVGESGSGKTTFAKAAVGLVRPTSGTIALEGKPLDFSGQQGRHLRRRIQYVLQDSLGSLDPRMRVLAQVIEPLIIHNIGRPGDRRDIAIELLARMGVGAHLVTRYPRSLSGGQRQRIALARALILRPEILICDESVSALDVSVQAQILNLLMELQREHDLSMLFISHDLSVIHHVSDRVAIMQSGQIVEIGDTEQVFGAPKHPYARQLISALPGFSPHQNPETPIRGIDACAG